ncbi:hypothetical protein OIU74_002048 [Salix koriyanagi]|uniref:Uncharacterized protein n=1 Tax=Salix koriyanagi TaxID=2511006 RepID=A0A9Q1AP71_9ROSI|nr:hypothetical protein OIU74_002048 [Salix koriyanagi]
MSKEDEASTSKFFFSSPITRADEDGVKGMQVSLESASHAHASSKGEKMEAVTFLHPMGAIAREGKGEEFCSLPLLLLVAASIAKEKGTPLHVMGAVVREGGDKEVGSLPFLMVATIHS